MRILFIDNYDSFTYNVVELLRRCDGVEYTIVKNDALRLVDLANFDKMIISPGPDLPSAANDLMWFLNKNLEKIPCLGICLGHQAIVEYFGGSLKQYAHPKHGEKTMLKQGMPNTLFNKLPEKFEVGLYHSWYAAMENMPSELKVSALSAEGIIMATEHENLPIYSVQFHPESYMSEHGLDILQNFIRYG